MTLKIGFLTSGNGEKMQAIQAAIKTGKLDARIVFIGADNNCPAITWAARNHISYWIVDYKKIIEKCQDIRKAELPEDFEINAILEKQKIYKPNNGAQFKYFYPRGEAEAAMLKNTEEKNLEFDILILDDFSHLLTPYFIDKVNKNPERPRILSISQELVPFFNGCNGYKDTWEYGSTIAGCGIHFVNYEKNTGAIILQKAFDIRNKSLSEIMEIGLQNEIEILIESIKLCSDKNFGITELPSGKWVTVFP